MCTGHVGALGFALLKMARVKSRMLPCFHPSGEKLLLRLQTGVSVCPLSRPDFEEAMLSGPGAWGVLEAAFHMGKDRRQERLTPTVHSQRRDRTVFPLIHVAFWDYFLVCYSVRKEALFFYFFSE